MRLILGGPGTGKTTRLISILEQELKTCDPTEVGFFSFTRKAAEEARDRVKVKFKYSDDDLPFFRTLHSLAFRQLGLTPDQVMSGSDYGELGSALGLKIGSPDNDFGLSIGQELGDQLVFMEQLSRVREVRIEDVARNLNLWHARRFQSALASFKKARGVIDFTDMITDFLARGDVPRFKVLFIDEAQDLTPIHWAVADALIAHADVTYIAGDDDQAIYRWAGADVNKFLGLEATTREVLPVSHRLNRQTWALAETIARRIGSRYAKQWRSRDEDGAINKFEKADDINMSDGSWLILARHGYLLEPLVHTLRRQGLPYIHKGKSSTNNETVRAIIAWETLRRGETVSHRAARNLLTHLRTAYVRVRLAKDAEGDDVTLSTLGLPPDVPDWMEAVEISDKEREYYRAVRRRGESLTKTPRIKVGTIHGSKGGEADHVMLLRDMSDRCHRDYVRRPDDECRVFYVGVSRALKSLYLQHPKTSRFFHLPH